MSDAFSFYEHVPVFKEFRDVTKLAHYRQVPDNWAVILIDVVETPKHIENGRYRDINLIASSVIIAVINTLNNKKFPFTFGGDGATLILPEAVIAQVKPALQAARHMAKAEFDFDLRIGIVPVEHLKKSGFDLWVSRHQISETSELSMIRGTAIENADKWVRQESRYHLPKRNLNDPPPIRDLFAGLQCRWQPLQARNGKVISLLVRSLKGDDIYVQVLESIQSILNQDQGNPASPRQMRMHWPLFQGLNREVRIQKYNRPWFEKLSHWFYLNWFIPLLGLSRFFNFNLGGGFNMRRYIDQATHHTDYRKFDDVLRMVLDVSIPQAKQMIAYLDQRKSSLDLVYGVQASNSAQMTCLVFTPDNHIHFVDGAHGGYSLASRQLKG